MSKSTSNSIQNSIDESLKESFPASDPPAWIESKKYIDAKKSDILEDTTHLTWHRKTSDFDYETYNRDAELIFGGGKKIMVSNPEKYFGNSEQINSEELLIASVSCCYMQTFLAIASKQGYNIASYEDKALGKLYKDANGKMSMREINLFPEVQFEGLQPNEATLQKLKNLACKNCFISNSVSSQVNVVITLKK